MSEQSVDLIALKIITARLDEFVAECVDKDGKPRAPSPQALAKVRGYLPSGCKMAYKAKEANP